MAEKKRTTVKDMFREGDIMRQYGTKAFVAISPVPSIDKVKVSIVKKGTAGKEHVNFWAEMDDFRQMCDDFYTGKAQKRINNDNGDYPGAYKFVGGKDGSRTMALGKGRSGGILFQVGNKSADGKWTNMITPVSAESLIEMAFHFRLVTGLIPVLAGTYYAGLIRAFYEGQKEREKYFRNAAQVEGAFEQPDQASAAEDTSVQMPAQQMAQTPPKDQDDIPEFLQEMFP